VYIIIIKSLLPSLFQREEYNPSLIKRGKGRFSKNYETIHEEFLLLDFAF
jgi:hypothetical protein